MEENIPQRMLGIGVYDVIQLVESSNSYKTLTNNVIIGENVYNSFSLIIQGTCCCNKKVTNAQEKRLSGSILYKIKILLIWYDWMKIQIAFHLLEYVSIKQ